MNNLVPRSLVSKVMSAIDLHIEAMQFGAKEPEIMLQAIVWTSETMKQ